MKYIYIIFMLFIIYQNFGQKKQNIDCQNCGSYFPGHYRAIPKELVGNNNVAFNTIPANSRLQSIIDNINIMYCQNKLSRVKAIRSTINRQDTL